MSIAKVLQDLLERAKEPLDDISDYSDEWCAGFVHGQQHALRVAVDEINKHLLGEDQK